MEHNTMNCSVKSCRISADITIRILAGIFHGEGPVMYIGMYPLVQTVRIVHHAGILRFRKAGCR